jgi:hypothetical protein
MNENDPRISDADRAILHSVQTGEGLIPISSVEELEALAEMARATMDVFQRRVADMTLAQAQFVRRLRVEEGYTWRAVAHACYVEWSGDWEPPSNQLAGMAICERAAYFWEEDYMEPPWNG